MTAGDWRSSVRFDLTAAVPPPAQLGRVHVLAVGGAGMSAVARLLHAAGQPVSGSDARDSAVLAALRAEGITVSVGHDPSHLDGVDTVVFSTAIREDNAELARARADGLRILHRSQALTSVMHDHRVVAVAGANGKTTTTSMLTELLIAAGADPSYAIGGELTGRGTNAALGSGDAFVVEADESDGSFLVYRPQVAVVTNVQADHLDFYGSFEAVREAYRAFVDTIAPGGLLVACADDPGSAALAAAHRDGGGTVVTYGTDPAADLVLADPRYDGLATRATARRPGRRDVTLELGVPGVHNLRNAAAAYLAATDGLGIDDDTARVGLAGFGGVRRRFEARGIADGVRVIDDYAHNPAKVAAVVDTARALREGGRLVAVFQPHLYSRTRDFAAEFGRALAPADVVVVLDVYAAREDPIPGVGGSLVAEAARRAGAGQVVDLATDSSRGVEGPSGAGSAPAAPGDRPRTAVPAGVGAAVGPILGLVGTGDLVVTIGAGDVTELGSLLLEALSAREGER